MQIEGRHSKIIERLIGVIESYTDRRFGAAIVKSGKLLSVTTEIPYTRHAETTALLALLGYKKRKRLCRRQHSYKKPQIYEQVKEFDTPIKLNKRYDIYVIRYQQSILQHSKPCKRCVDALKRSGIIVRVIYIDENGELAIEKIDEIENSFSCSFHATGGYTHSRDYLMKQKL